MPDPALRPAQHLGVPPPDTPHVTSEPFCSVIIPCRNERGFIGSCLASILAGTYPLHRLEVIVVDGLSDDGTRETVTEYARRHAIVRVLDNPKQVTPSALNIAVANARGDVIVRLDAHALYPPDYIRRCVEILMSSGADCVGGVLTTRVRDRTVFASGIELALTHVLGVGNSKFRLGVKAPQWVDAVPFGCMRKELFLKVGLFNETLHRSQDWDFWNRVRRAGGKILLHPSIQCVYLARGTLEAICRYNFANGYWVTWPMRRAGTRFAPRHVMPLAFCVSLVAAGAGGILWPGLWAFGLAVLGFYAALSIGVSAVAAVYRRNAGLLLTGPVAFAAMHFSYGLGSMWGMVRPMGEAAARPRGVGRRTCAP
jgi:glycosyltransferase involved in cell wall biosynthesis